MRTTTWSMHFKPSLTNTFPVGFPSFTTLTSSAARNIVVRFVRQLVRAFISSVDQCPVDFLARRQPSEGNGHHDAQPLPTSTPRCFMVETSMSCRALVSCQEQGVISDEVRCSCQDARRSSAATSARARASRLEQHAVRCSVIHPSSVPVAPTATTSIA